MVDNSQFSRSIVLNERLNQLIPGGAHTYAKGVDQFPLDLAPVIASGKGCRVTDADGNEFIEYGMGLRAVSLGHAWDSVDKAASQAMSRGMNFTRPSVLELEMAERFLANVPAADMVKFAKNGSDCTTAALRLARSVTGREKVAICANHPFFSVDDWFIGSTAIHSGIPTSTREATLKFEFNDIDSVRRLFDQHAGQIACVVMEPEKEVALDMSFIKELQALCRNDGALFVLDEMITGYRWGVGGAQGKYGITPDLSTFGKAMGNGFAISALAGKREFMERGGLFHDQDRVFLLSCTHGAESASLAAAGAVLDVYQNEPVIETLAERGELLRKLFQQAIDNNSLQGHMGIVGHPACMVFTTADAGGQPSQPMRTLFMQECIRRGLLAPSLVLSYSHTEDDIQQTVEIANEAMGVYRRALEDGVERYLEGRSVQPVYRNRN